MSHDAIVDDIDGLVDAVLLLHVKTRLNVAFAAQHPVLELPVAGDQLVEGGVEVGVAALVLHGPFFEVFALLYLYLLRALVDTDLLAASALLACVRVLVDVLLFVDLGVLD